MITLDGCGEEIRVGFKLVTGPTMEPVEISELKPHARWDGDDLDETLQAYLTAARLQVEARTRLVAVNSTYDVSFDKAPGGRWLTMPLWPLVSVSSITTYDLDHAATVMSSSDYATDLISQPSRVVLKSTAVWPSPLRPVNGIVVRGVFGHGASAAAVDERVRHAIRILATHYLETPGPEGAATLEVPEWFDRVLDGLGLVAL